MISNNAYNAIAALDLNQIKTKLMHVQSGEGWSQEKVDAVEVEYRRFLYLMKAFPNETTVPLVEVDIFWHYHILDTLKYAQDCEQAFGYFVHHYPYVGMEGRDDDEEVHNSSVDRMRELYESTFEVPYASNAAAFCARTQLDATSAFCARTQVEAKSAFCAQTSVEAKSAFCAQTSVEAKSAFCARTPAEAKSAFCARTQVEAKSAFCARTPMEAKSAFCARTQVEAKSAFCARTQDGDPAMSSVREMLRITAKPALQLNA